MGSGMSRATKTLGYGVRPRVVALHLGQLLLGLAALTAVPAVVAAFDAEPYLAGACAAVAAAAALGGWALRRAGEDADLQRNEGLVVVAGIFTLAAGAMTLPMLTAGLAPVDALFESVSGVTTTGLSTLSTVEGSSFSFHFLRSWMQWYGGFGIVALVIAVTPASGVAAVRLASASGRSSDEDRVGSMRGRVRRLVVVYLTLTAVAIGLLLLAGAGARHAVQHALSAVSTGGFSNFDASLAGFASPWTASATLLVSTAGSISFALYARAREDGPKVLLRDPDLRVLLLAATLVSVGLAAILWLVEDRPFGAALGHGFALGFSAHTTTGFSTLRVAELSDPAKLLTIAAMFVGGDLGSTAGGLKIVRALVLLRVMVGVIERVSLPPHAVAEPTLHGRRIEPDELQRTVVIFLCLFMVNAGSWLLFVLAGHAPLDSLFDVVSATGTVGLSTGVVSAELSAPLKLLLCADMLLGRLEVVALLVLFLPRTWFGRKRQT